MRSLSCIAIALAMTCSCVAAYASNTILLTRPINGTYNGSLVPAGSGLFTINDNGSNLRQLTPLEVNSWYVPSGVGAYGPGRWLTRNFSPDGQDIQYFYGQTTDPSAGGPTSGKYYTMNLRTGVTQPLFDGSNDNAAPGYGYLAWGPVGSNVIAYASPVNGTTPACVYLMQPDGSNKHSLWCAPTQVTVIGGAVPTAAIDTIRWAGNGQRLLAFVQYKPNGGYYEHAAVYRIDVQTGEGTLIDTNAVDAATADISYDGTKILYQKYGGSCADWNPKAVSINLCVRDMRAGHIHSVLPPGVWSTWGQYGVWWLGHWAFPLLLSPDGSQVAFMLQSSGALEADVYVINSDGTNLRQLTAQGPIENVSAVEWVPVAWSPDGTQVLANRTVSPVFGATDQTWPGDVHIITIDSDKDRLVTNGYAVDWYRQ
jgi:Tol biopolymer transport system component